MATLFRKNYYTHFYDNNSSVNFIKVQIKFNMERYKIISHISAGAHGVILKAKNVSASGRSNSDDRDHLVAIKRIFIRGHHKHIPLNLIREIKSLQLLNGENYVGMFSKTIY